MDAHRKIPNNLFSFRKNNNSSEKTDAPPEKNAPTPLTESVKRINPVLGKNRELPSRLKTQSTPRSKGNSEAKQAKLSSHRKIRIDSENDLGSERADDSTTSSRSRTNSDAEESLPDASRTTALPFIAGRRKAANTLDPKRFNYQPNIKNIDSIEIFALTAKNKDKISSIRTHLPPGMNLDGRGIVFGGHVHVMTPSHAKLPHIPIEEALAEELTKEHLATTQIGKMPREIAGIKVVNACDGDFHRLMYKFPTIEGDFAELPWPSNEEIENKYQEINQGASDKKTIGENLRKEQIARQVRSFVEDENTTNEQNNNAAFVISALLHQGISTALSVIAFGENPAFKMLSMHATQEVGRNMTIKDRNGNLQPQLIAGLGNIKFTLSRRDNNFIIGADLPMYGEARPGREKDVPLHQDGVIGLHARMEMVVDGTQARNGVLALTIPDGVHVAYSGGFTF